MTINRRDLLQASAMIGVATALPRLAVANTFAPTQGDWRHFQTVTRIEIPRDGAAQAWLPLPAFAQDDWFRPQSNDWTTNAKSVEIKRDPKYGAQLLHVVWPDNEPSRFVEVTSKFATRDRSTDFAKPGNAAALTDDERQLYLAATELIPTDGIVKETSEKIVGEGKSDVEKARAIYQWVVDNTYWNAKTRGCGIGDVASLLQSGNLGGKCADINALFVGLARAAGLPARDVYGLRVAPSGFGYKSLGANSETVTKSQHCRAEVHLAGFGWVPVDPADVRKVVLEEPPGNLPLEDPKVTAARNALFGAWEMNWLAYNAAHDLALPGAQGPKLAFLMYPQAEIRGERIDCLDPDKFVYVIKAKQLPSPA